MNLIDESFPKFQYSIFDKNGVNAQWVVRGNNWKKFLMDVEVIKTQVNHNEIAKPEGEKFADTLTTPATPTPSNNPVCPVHHKEMTLGKWGWYCKTKTGDGPKDWCKYNPAEKESKEAFNG